MTGSPCSHGYASSASCTECMLDGPVRDQHVTPWRVAATFGARLEGKCGGISGVGCAGHLMPGQVVHRLERDNRGDLEVAHVHAGCQP